MAKYVIDCEVLIEADSKEEAAALAFQTIRDVAPGIETVVFWVTNDDDETEDSTGFSYEYLKSKVFAH